MKATDFLDEAPSADDFLGDATPAAPSKLGRLNMGRGNALRPKRPQSVLEGIDMEPGVSALFPQVLPIPAPTGDLGARLLGEVDAMRTPVQRAAIRHSDALARQARQEREVLQAREATDAAFGKSPVAQAIAAPARRLAAGAAQVVGGVASAPQLFGSNLGRETAQAAELMARANMPEDPGLADEVLAGGGQILPMVGGAAAIRAALLPLLGDAAATGLAATLSGAAGGAMSGGEVLRDLEGRTDLSEADKRTRAGMAALFSGLTGKYADRFLIPGADKAATGALQAGGRAFLAEGVQEGLDQAGQNLATDRPLQQGVGRAALVGGIVGGGSRVATEVGSDANLLAQAIEADANAFADAPAPVVVQQPVARAVGAPLPQPAPAPAAAPVPALPYDPSVGPNIMVAGADGAVRPMTADEFLQAEDARQEGIDTGLTPDVRRAQEMRSEPGEAVVEPDLVQRLVAAGWKPPETTNASTAPEVDTAAAADRGAAPDGTQAAAAARADGAAADGVLPNAADRELTEANAADFERLYQQDVKEAIRGRLGLKQADTRPDAPKRYSESALIRGIAAAGGIEKGQMSDTGVDKKRLTSTGRIMPIPYNIDRRPLFRERPAEPVAGERGPMRGDMLVEHLVQSGYLTQQEVDEAEANGVGGSEELAYDLVRRELADPGSVVPAADRTGQLHDQRAARMSDELQRQASAIGFDTAGMEEAQVASALKRIERRRTEAQTRRERFDAAEEARLEREAIQMADAFTVDELDALDSLLRANENMTLAETMRALGFTDQEIADAQAREAGGRQEADGDAGARAPAAGLANEGSEGGRGQALESYSPDEVVQRQDRAAQAERDGQRQQQEAERRAAADRQRGDFTLTGSDRAADSNPDQDDLFSRRAPGASTADSLRTELRERFGDIIGRLERRGFLKLWDSVQAYNESGQFSQLPPEASGAAQGMYSHRTGIAHLFADGIEPGTAVAVMLHEVGEHASMKAMLGEQRYADLVKRAYALAREGDEVAEIAMMRIPEDTPRKFYDSEMVAYLIEEATNRQDASPGLRRWVADAIAGLRAWFYQTGFAKQLERYGVRLDLTPKEFAALAVRAVRWQAEQGGQEQRAGDAQPAFSKAPPTESEAFRRWFGDSKVVDAEGKPLVVYHGTRHDVTEFKDDFGRARTAIQKMLRKIGIKGTDGDFFFAVNPEFAGAYAGLQGKMAGGNVMPVYLSVQNPMVLDVKAGEMAGEGSVFERARKAGHDGILLRGWEEGWLDASDGERGITSDVYIAFDAKQIKSAIGNSGTFDPQDPDIRFSKNPPLSATGSNPFAGQQFGPQPWTVAEPGTWDNIVRAMQDSKVDLKRVRAAIEKRFGKIPDSADTYLQEELYHGKVAARVEKLHREAVEPILRKIAVAGEQHGVTLDDVNLYLHAKHAPERNAAMARINPNMPNNQALSGMSDADAAKALADFQRAGKAQALDTIAKDVYQLLADTRTALVADGLEEASTVQAWEQAYQNYVPLMRDVEDRPAKGQGVSVRGPEAKRAVGSNRQVVNILANAVTQAETAAIRAEKAQVGRSLLEMAQAYTNADFWTVDTPPVKPRVNQNTGLVERSAVDPTFQTADNVVMVKDYGAVRFIVFNKGNERAMAMAHAMKNLDVQQVPRAIRYFGAATRFMASLLTQRNPEFWLTNFARDLQGSMIQMSGTDAEGLQAKVLKSLPKAMAGMRHVARGTGARTQWARYAQELKDAGGTTGYMQQFENSNERMRDLQREVDRMQQGKADPRRLVRSMIDFIDDYNEVIENGMRLAVFQAAREAGVPTERAASIAKNITVNFNRKGTATPIVNSLYMFFNAGLQGTARLAQALATSNRARVAVGTMAAVAFVMDVVNRAIAGDDEETKRNRYDLINEFEKSKNWIFMLPDGKYVKVPLPIGFNIFHNAGRLMSDAIFREDPRDATEYGWAFASTMLDAFSPLGTFGSVGQLIAPSVLRPAVQLAENKNAFGTPVYKSEDKGFGKVDPKPAYTRHFDSTPDLWKAASKTLNDVTGGDKVQPGLIDIEPDVMRFVYGTLTGGPGRALDKTIDTTQAKARGEEVTPARIPFVHRFVGATDDRQRDAAYYQDLKRAEKAKTQFDYYTKNGRRDLALEVLKDLGQGDLRRGRQVIAEYERAKKDDRIINRRLRQLAEQKDDGRDVTDQVTKLKQQKRAGHRRVLSATDGDDEE